MTQNTLMTTLDEINQYVHQKLDEYDNDEKKITDFVFDDDEHKNSKETEEYVQNFVQSLETNPSNYKTLWEMYHELQSWADQDEMLWSDEWLIMTSYIYMICTRLLCARKIYPDE